MKRFLLAIFCLLVSSTATAREKSFLGVRLGDGKTVAEVIADSPAAKAGFMVGDIIDSVDEKFPESTLDLQQTIADVKPGKQVKFGVARDGEPVELEVKLARRSVKFFLTQESPPRVPGGSISLGGGTIGGAFTNSGNLIVHRATSTVQGDFEQAWSGVLDVKIDKRNDHPTLTVTGKAKLAGLLYVAFDGVDLKIGDRFEVVSGATGLNGRFDDFMLPDLGIRDGKQLTCILKYDDVANDRDLDRDGKYDVFVEVVDADTVMPEVPLD